MGYLFETLMQLTTHGFVPRNLVLQTADFGNKSND